jgi:O-antigen ligase
VLTTTVVVVVAITVGVMLGVALRLPEKYALTVSLGLTAAPVLLLVLMREPQKRLLGLYILLLPISPGLMLAERLAPTPTTVNVLIQVFVSDLVLLALAAVVTWNLWSRNLHKSIWQAPTTLPLLLWTSAGVLSIIPAIDKLAVVEGALQMGRIGLLYWIVYHVSHMETIDRTVVLCLFLALVIQAGIMFGQFATGSPLVDVPGVNAVLLEEDQLGAGLRPSGTLGHSSQFARVAGLILPMALGWALFTRGTRDRTLGVIVLLVGMAAMGLTVSRIGMIATAISIAAFLGGSVVFGCLRAVRAILLAATLLLAGAGLALVIAGNQWQARLADDGGSAALRPPMYAVALNVIKDKMPWGVGLNNYTLVHRLYDETPERVSLQFPDSPVHNLYLLYAAEIGLLGVVGFLWFQIATFGAALDRLASAPAENRPTILAMGCGVLNICVQNLTGKGTSDHVIHLSVIVMFAALLSAMRTSGRIRPGFSRFA